MSHTLSPEAFANLLLGTKYVDLYHTLYKSVVDVGLSFGDAFNIVSPLILELIQTEEDKKRTITIIEE